MANIVKENSDVRKGKDCRRDEKKNDEDAPGILIVMCSTGVLFLLLLFCFVLRFGAQIWNTM